MIQWKTILSVFDNKPTLLQYLKKLEKALIDSTLTSVEVINVDEWHIKLEFKFANAESIITNDIELNAVPDILKKLLDVIEVDGAGNITFGHNVYADGTLETGNDVKVGRDIIIDLINQIKTPDGDYALSNKNVIYSTSEVDTGATWVDGKKIYKKTGYLARIVAGEPYTYIVRVNQNVNIIKTEGFATEVRYGIGYNIPFTDITNSNFFVFVQSFADGSTVRCGADRDFRDVYVTIYYTK